MFFYATEFSFLISIGILFHSTPMKRFDTIQRQPYEKLKIT